MYGPYTPERGWREIWRDEYKQLKRGQRYRVLRAFVDYDGDSHPAGEAWTFLGSGYLPHDDGLSLFVSLDGQRAWHVRLQERPEAQGHMIGALADFIGEATSG